MQFSAKQCDLDRQERRAARLIEQLDDTEVTLSNEDDELIRAHRVILNSKHQTYILRNQLEAMKSLKIHRKTDY